MHNRPLSYLTANEILCVKQSGFQKGHSAEHAIMQLTNRINNRFEKNHFNLCVFIDLSKAFLTVYIVNKTKRIRNKKKQLTLIGELP